MYSCVINARKFQWWNTVARSYYVGDKKWSRPAIGVKGWDLLQNVHYASQSLKLPLPENSSGGEPLPEAPELVDPTYRPGAQGGLPS